MKNYEKYWDTHISTIHSTLKLGNTWFTVGDSDLPVILKGKVVYWNRKHRYGFVENYPCIMQNFGRSRYYFGDNYPSLVDISEVKEGMIVNFHLGLDKQRQLMYAGIKELNANSYLN